MLIAIALAIALQADPLTDLERAVRAGIEGGAYPGAVVVVGTADTVLHAAGYGHFTWSAESRVPDPDSTIYDLASLTKVVATTPAVMRLVQDGRVDLDAPVQRYLSGFVGDEKEAVSVRHLLAHRSGLREFLPLHEWSDSPEEARRLVLEEPLRRRAGTRVAYSDLNAMLLGWIVEEVAEQPLDRFVATEVFSALGMSRTMFRPPRHVRPHMVPVGLWHGHVIAGELHDQNAVRLGGVSGHAGLYSTGADLARYAQLLLRHGRRATGERLLDSTTVAAFTLRGSGNRALGWEMRDPTDSANAGTLLSARAYGHGGFTGTSIWIDPERDVFVIVLTNRVFAPRTGRSISTLKRVRGRVADAAVRLRAQECASVVLGAKTRRRC
jgi:CubicO group peptidase (beta-lactamase class C family)